MDWLLSPAMDGRRQARIVFPAGHCPIVKYKLISKAVPVNDTVYDAQILDLSTTGARFTGPLPDRAIYQLGMGEIQLGCNLILRDNIVKVLATMKWFKSTDLSGEFQFGVRFQLTEAIQSDIQKFLIRHQLDTRKLVRIKHEA